MSPEELKKMCEEAINQRRSIKFKGEAKIAIKMPESKSRPKKRRLLGRKGGPMGDVVAWGFDGFDTVIFDAREVWECLKRNE